MGYNIEVSFNVLKTGSVTELQQNVKNYAEECGCDNFYEDYEFENNFHNQCVITVGFDNENICYLIVFLKNIRSKKYIYIENIYDDNSRQILYASKYYITQKMDKGYSRLYKEERRKRSYSEDDTMILDVINKTSNY